MLQRLSHRFRPPMKVTCWHVEAFLCSIHKCHGSIYGLLRPCKLSRSTGQLKKGMCAPSILKLTWRASGRP